MQWADLIGPASGALVAFVGLWRASVLARSSAAKSASQSVSAREGGAAAVVPGLLERMEAQDRKIEALRAEVDACEERSSALAKELARAQSSLDRALEDLSDARRQINALVALLPARDRDRVQRSLAPPAAEPAK